jgi:hypothetical protein
MKFTAIWPQRKRFCRFHRNTAVSAPPAFAPCQYSANPRHGNEIPLTFNRLPDEPHMTNPLSAFVNKYVFFRGSPLQLIRTGLAGILFPSSQVISICGRIRLHDLNFERFVWHEGLRLSTYFRHAFESGKLCAHNQGWSPISAAEIVAPLW